MVKYKYIFSVDDNDEDYTWHVYDQDNNLIISFNEHRLDNDVEFAKQFVELDPEYHIRWLYPHMLILIKEK